MLVLPREGIPGTVVRTHEWRVLAAAHHTVTHEHLLYYYTLVGIILIDKRLSRHYDELIFLHT